MSDSSIWLMLIGVFGGALALVLVLLARSGKPARRAIEAAPCLVSEAPSGHPPAGAALREVGGNRPARRYELRKSVTAIGRDPSLNDMVLPYDTVSARHAVIEYRGGLFYLRDLRSSNGTFAGGKRLGDCEVLLKEGDRVRFDTYEYEFATGAPSAGKTRLHVDALPEVEEPRTLLKPATCPNHPAWQGSERCEACGQGVCRLCIREKDGRRICPACAGA